MRWFLPTELDVRSWLFIPGDSERKLSKLASVAADAVILDLEDAVMPANKAIAREYVRAALEQYAGERSYQLWVRINPLSSGLALADLAAVIGGRPDGIMLPKIDTAADLARLDAYIAALETREALPAGNIHIVPVATETARSLFELGGLGAATARLRGVTWGAEDLAVDLGAASNRNAQGEWLPTFQLARSLTLAAAAAAQVAAIDTVYTDFRDEAGLAHSCELARRDGFTGKLAIHPGQVATINAAFTPSEQECQWARQVLALFESAQGEGQGVLQLDGRMLDAPHLKQARRILELQRHA